MIAAERQYQYPRRMELVVELLSAVGIVVALVYFGRDLLRFFWFSQGVDTALFTRLPFLRTLVSLAAADSTECCSTGRLSDLIPSLTVLLGALFVALLIRHSLPNIRTSARGMLVEFAGGWLPVPWESITAIKVTEVKDRFVLLAETNGRYLTGWHRFYGFIYRFGFRPAILITSSIGDFDGLIKTLLSETDRVARALEGRGAQLQEEATSPLFRLLLSPRDFFSQKATQPASRPASPGAAPTRGNSVTGIYPRQITALLRGGALLFGGLVIVRAIGLFLVGMALLAPPLRQYPPFSWLDYRVFGPAWWPIAAAAILLIVGLAIAFVLLALLPDLKAQREGLAIQIGRRWRVIPWNKLAAVKVTELSEASQIVLIQVADGLPFVTRLIGMLYDRSLRPSVLLTSAWSSFEPLLQRVILEVMGGPTGQQNPNESPIFQSEARSNLLLGTFSPNQAIDKLVEDARADDATKQAVPGRLLRAAWPMVALALLPPLILLADRLIQQVIVPDARVFAVAAALFLLGMLEWPIVALTSVVLDESTGGGEEGARVWYLYPITQLPRIVALVVVFALVLIAAPFLPALIWLAALAWIFVLAAGLWGALYDWRGGLLLAGGLIPALFQIIVLIAYLILRR